MGISFTTPAAFTGSSAFSTQLQQVITNAVTAASAPMQQLQNQQSTLNNQQSELQTLSGDFQSLQSALDSLNGVSGSNAYSASVSSSSVASASVSSGVMAGTYTLNVTNVGSSTNTMSMNGLTTVSDPTTGNIDSSSTYTLTVNGQQYQISDSTGSLNGLAQAINASGAKVEATVVNVGSNSSPDYRLSVQSLDYAPDTIQLSDGTNNLLNSLATGSYVQYQVNGQPTTPINSSTRTIDLSTGLTAQVLGTGTTSITVSQSTSAISNALSGLANAYDKAAADLAKNRGQNGGALTGQSIVFELQNALDNMAGYAASSGNVLSLADLGVTFDQNGNLQFSQSTLDQAAPTDVVSFLGSESAGGFLQSAQNIMTGLTDPSSGILTQETQSIGTQITNIGTKITADQQQVNQLQQTLTSQMSAADATISSMEQQVSEITNLFTDMQQNAKNNG